MNSTVKMDSKDMIRVTSETEMMYGPLGTMGQSRVRTESDYMDVDIIARRVDIRFDDYHIVVVNGNYGTKYVHVEQDGKILSRTSL